MKQETATFKKYIKNKKTGQLISIDDIDWSDNNNNTSNSRAVSNNPLLEYKKNPLVKDKVVKEMRIKYGHYSSINTDTIREDSEAKTATRPKKQIKPYSFQPIPDSRLLDLANQYLTTDESLERFQNEQRIKSNEDVLSSSSHISTHNRLRDDKPRRINGDLDYYNKIK